MEVSWVTAGPSAEGDDPVELVVEGAADPLEIQRVGIDVGRHTEPARVGDGGDAEAYVPLDRCDRPDL